MVYQHSKLDAAYRATAYVVRLPDGGPLTLRVDESSPRLDNLLEAHAHSTWAFITACNPQSQCLTDTENAARQADLIQVVLNLRLQWHEGQGVPDHPGWAPEPSLLVLGIAHHTAHELAVKFGQKALLFGRLGGTPQLQYTVGNSPR
jgi:hypothetical protein